METREFQVCIYFDRAEGQNIQTSYKTYLEYYKHLGWHLLNKAPMLPEMPKPDKDQVMETEFMM